METIGTRSLFAGFHVFQKGFCFTQKLVCMLDQLSRLRAVNVFSDPVISNLANLKAIDEVMVINRMQ
jgi:hypothetical protein